MMDEKNEGGMMCKCGHHKVVPALIIAFGLAFLLSAMNVITAETRNIVWPIIVMVIGFMKMNRGMCNCCKGGNCRC